MIDRNELSEANIGYRFYLQRCIEHNLRVSGKDNYPRQLCEFMYDVGFVFERPDGSLWKVEKKFLRESQAFAMTLDRKHSALWWATTKVKVPEGYLASYG